MKIGEWCERVRGPRARRKTPRQVSRRPLLERLEDRLAPAGHILPDATPLTFGAFPIAHVSGFLATVNQVDLYKVHLDAGDRITAKVSAQVSGSGLQSLIRVFDSTGTQRALDDQEGGDPRLPFQAAAADDYFVGVSASGDDGYDPTTVINRPTGRTTGLYSLDVRLTQGAALQPDLTGSSFRLTTGDTAAVGDQVGVNFTVENRGAADPGNFTVELRLSRTNVFDASSTLLQTFTRAELTADATGERFGSPTGFYVTLPSGLASGPVDVGLRIVPDPLGADANPFDKSGVHRGEDWESLTVVTPVSFAALSQGQNNLSQVDAGLNTRATYLFRPGTGFTGIDFPFTVTPAMGTVRLTASLAPVGDSPLIPQLVLRGLNGQILAQSDASGPGGAVASFVQNLAPGIYSLVVSGQMATGGGYQLTTTTVASNPPFDPLPVDSGPALTVAGDFNGDGTLDLAVANAGDSGTPGHTVGLFLNNGDGTFRTGEVLTVGSQPPSLAVSDLNGDGRLDLVVANPGSDTLSVLLGMGDGTFQDAQTIPAGSEPDSVTVVDLDGDGRPDLVVADRGDGAIRVLRNTTVAGAATLTFDPAQTFGVGQLPIAVVSADLDGDGRPDIAEANYGGSEVTVLHNDTATGGPIRLTVSQVPTVGHGPSGLAAGDFNGDGKPDLAVSNFGSIDSAQSTVSVLLNLGSGTFAAQQVYAVGVGPSGVTLTDFNGDGQLDVAVSSSSNGLVSVLTGRGDGTFLPQKTSPAGETPVAVLAADLDGDGHPDLVTTNFSPGTVTLLRGTGDGSFRPSLTFAVGSGPQALARGDVNGDGRPDVAVANFGSNTVSILISNGDGTFQVQRILSVGASPDAVVLADVNGDGRMDLVVANRTDGTVGMLLSNGDGSFRSQQVYQVGLRPSALAVIDLDGDKKLDIVVTNQGDGTVSVLLGNGDGTFRPRPVSHVSSRPTDVAVADINGDGIRDLAVANYGDGTVGILLGQGHGIFGPQQLFHVGPEPVALAVEDLDGDKKLDVVAVNHGDGTIGVLRNRTAVGAATLSFATMPLIRGVGPKPLGVAVADITRDGIPDILVTNTGDMVHPGTTVSVLPGNGDATFGAPLPALPVGHEPSAIAIADFNGDGLPDLVVSNFEDNTVSVLLGTRDGTFLSPTDLARASNQTSVVVADINHDGILDLVSTNYDATGTVGIALGRSDGTFGAEQRVAAGYGPFSVVVADASGLGNSDLVVAEADGTLSVLSNTTPADSPTVSFLISPAIVVGSVCTSAVVADVNGDGAPDLIATDYVSGTVAVVLGAGGGSFLDPQFFSAGTNPYTVDVVRGGQSGLPDLVFTDTTTGTIDVLHNQTTPGSSTLQFDSPSTFAVGAGPHGFVVRDFNGDGIEDVAAANAGDNTVSVLLGRENGTFQDQQVYGVGVDPNAVTFGDYNNDGQLDLAVANFVDGTVSILLGKGDGTFKVSTAVPTGTNPLGIATADLRGDGRLWLITANFNGSSLSVLQPIRGGAFATSNAVSGSDRRNTPFVVDLDGDGIPDSVILDKSGRILFRKGLGGPDQAFESPRTLNPGSPARDVTVLRTPSGWAIAAAAALPDPSQDDAFPITLYSVTPDRHISSATAFTTFQAPTRLVAGRLTGSGRDDLVVAHALDNAVTIGMQDGTGQFSRFSRSTGTVPSDLALADVSGTGGLDIVATDQAGGDVSVLYNDAFHSFTVTSHIRVDTGPYSSGATVDNASAASLAEPVGLAGGNLTGNDRNDLVVVNRGAHTFTVLPNNGHGGFGSPQVAFTASTSLGTDDPNQPGPVVVGDFDRNGKQDLAILMTDTSEVWVFRNKGDGTFYAPVINPAGAGATGFSFVQGVHGAPDRFLIGNNFGDILTLVGNDTGHFALDRSDLTARPLAVGKTSDGRSFAVVADQQLDRVQAHFRDPAMSAGFDGPHTLDSSAAPLLAAAPLQAPGAIVLADLQNNNGNTPPSMIVANRLGNQILVYPGLPGGAFGTPVAYDVGFEPVAVTVADLNGDGVPDLAVVNHGSNDVSILIGGIDPVTKLWTGTHGPRLDSGGSGPVAVEVGDFTRDGIPDLRVTNGDGHVATLTGIGSAGKGTAFFLPPPASVPSLGAAITQEAFDPTTGRSFFVSGGQLSVFDGTTFTTLATGGTLTTLDVVAGLLVAGFADGSVGLVSEDGTVLERSASFGDQPSALEALQNGGSIDVYLTLDGSQVPVFVSLLIPVVTELPSAGAVASATSVTGADLVLVATLLTGGLEEGTLPTQAELASTEATFILFLPPVKVRPVGDVGNSEGEAESVSVALVVRADPDGEPPTAEFRQRVQDALEERLSGQQVFDTVEDLIEAIRGALEWFEGGSKAAPDGPQSRWEGDRPGLSEVAEAVGFADVAERGSEGVVGDEAIRPAEDLAWHTDPNESVWDSLWSLESAVLAVWLCRPPEMASGRRRIRTRELLLSGRTK